MAEDLRTPEQWQAVMPEVRILDRDGWRGSRGRSWSEPISREEYLWRRSLCTVTGPTWAYDRDVHATGAGGTTTELVDLDAIRARVDAGAYELGGNKDEEGT